MKKILPRLWISKQINGSNKLVL
ncbi:hypothetical protein EMIT0196P_10469 [Pseudomonas chlororaphis]